MKKRIINCLAFGLVAALFAGCATSPTADTEWDYWVTEGPAGVVLPGTEMRLKQGYRIERMIATPRELKEDPHVIVILKREKARQVASDVAFDSRVIREPSDPFRDPGPLEYRPVTFDSGESLDRDRSAFIPENTIRFGPSTKLRVVDDSYETQWPIRARPAPRPEHLIDTKYTIPGDALDVGK